MKRAPALVQYVPTYPDHAPPVAPKPKREGWGGLTVAALALPLLLGACTASDALVARQLTLVDGAAFVQENHSRRQAMRQQYYQVVDEVIGKCKEAARSAQFEGDFDAALARVDWCLDFMEKHYPSLATIELMREGFDAIDDLQQRLDEPGAPPVILGGGGHATGGAN